MLPSGSHGHLCASRLLDSSFGRIQQFAATLNASYLKSKLIAYFADFICVNWGLKHLLKPHCTDLQGVPLKAELALRAMAKDNFLTSQRHKWMNTPPQQSSRDPAVVGPLWRHFGPTHLWMSSEPL